MAGKLISLAKDGREKLTFPVVSLHVFIGSDSYCDIRIRQKDVSPQHCLITAQKDKPTLIRNLSRTSPTLVNGAEIGSMDVELVDQDIITICNRQFRWKYDSLSSLSDEYNTSQVKVRKSWPVFKNKLVAVVTPHRRDEDLPLKKRRNTYGADNLNASKKGRVLAIKSGVKGKKTNIKKPSIKISPAIQMSLSQSLCIKRKSVKFAETPLDRRLGKRSKIIHGPPTPYRPSITPGKKASLYLTPPSGMGSSKTPTKGILKTPGTQSRNENQSTSKLAFSNQLPNLDSTPPALPLLLSASTEPIDEESNLRTPPKDESNLPEIVMRSSKRSSRRGITLSPESTPKSASKARIRRNVSDEESFEASERAAKKLKLNPPAAIDKKKIAAIMQCHRKSLTPHPAVNKKGRTLISVPSPKPQPVSSPKGTPKSTKKIVKSRKSEPTPYSSVVPKALKFGLMGNTDPKSSLIRKKKKSFKPIKLERKYPIGRSSVAKMLSSPSPPGRKMTRATRAARASREQVQKREATDVLSALDLSRKWPTESGPELPDIPQKPTSPIADTSASGIKELFSTEKTVNVRELFLEGKTENSPKVGSLSSTPESKGKKSRQSSILKDSETSFNSMSSFTIDGAQELPASPSVSSSQLNTSMSRRSLTLKGIKSSPLLSLSVNSGNVTSSSSNSTKKKIPYSKQSISASDISGQSDNEESFEFSLGSFDSSKHKKRESSLSPISSEKNYQSPIEKITPNKMSTSFKSSVFSSKKKSRTSLRRVALSTSTTKTLNMSMQEFQSIGKITSLDSPEDSPNQTLASLPSKKRSLKTVLNSSLKSRQSRRLFKSESTTNSTISIPSPNKSKRRTSTSYRENRLENISNQEVADGSHLSNASLKVHVGCSPKNVDLSSYSSSVSISNLNRWSESNNTEENHSSSSSSPKKSYSAKKRKDLKNDEFNSFLVNKSTRSRSSVNIDLFSLDKLPLDIPSSTPLRSKPIKQLFKGETSFNNKVNRSLIGSDSLESTFKNSRRRFVAKKSLSTSGIHQMPSTESVDDLNNCSHQSEITETSDKGDKSVDNKLISKTPQSSAKSFESHKKTDQINTSSKYSGNKSTRSKSTIMIDLFKLDDNPSCTSTSKRRSKSAEVVRRKSTVSKVMNSSSLLFKSERTRTPVETSWNKSTTKSETFSCIGIHNSTLLCKSERTRTPVETSWNKSTTKSETLSSIGIHNSTLLCKSERTRTPIETSWNKSTRSKSSVNIDLFKLDDKPYHESNSVNDTLLRDKSADTVLKNPVSNSNSKSQLGRIKKSSASDSSVDIYLSEPSNKYSGKRSKSPVVIGRNSVTNSNVSEILANKSLVNISKTRSTRSTSSVNIDLFKLDDKSPKYPESKLMNEILSMGEFLDKEKPKICKSPSNIQLERSRKYSLPNSAVDIDLSVLSNKLSPEENVLKRSRSSEVIDKKSVSNSNVSKIFDSESLVNVSKARSTRSKSSVSIDLFKLDDKSLKCSGRKSMNEILPMGDSSDSFSDKPKISTSNSYSKVGRPRKSSVPNSSLDIDISNLDKFSPSKNIKRNKSSEVIDRKSKTNVSEIFDKNIMDVSKTRPTRSKSSININLFKLDDKPSESSLIKKSRSKSVETTPKISKKLHENEPRHLLVSTAHTIGKEHSEISEADAPVLDISVNKSSRKRSYMMNGSNSVNERPSASMTHSSFGRESFEGKVDLGFPKQLNDSNLSLRGHFASLGSITKYNKSKKSLSEISPSEIIKPKKETRSRSTIDIDTFKINERSSDTINLVEKSFLKKPSKKSNASLISPKSRNLEEKNKSIKVRNSRNAEVDNIPLINSRNSLKSKFEASLLDHSTKKSTRSKSTINIDLFKLDSSFSDKNTSNGNKSDSPQMLAHSTPALPKNTHKSKVGLDYISPNITMSKSSINNNLFNNDQSSSHKKSQKGKRSRSKSPDLILHISSGLNESKHLSKSLDEVVHITDSPSELSISTKLTKKGKKRSTNSGENIDSAFGEKSHSSKCSSNVDILKLDNTDSLKHLSFNSKTINTRSSETTDDAAFSPLKQASSLGSSKLNLSKTLSKVSLRNNSSPMQAKKSQSSDFNKPGLLENNISASGDKSFGNRSTRSSSTFDLNTKNESPNSRSINTPKQNKMSSLTPSLKQLTLKSTKKVSISTSPLKPLRSPRLRISRLTESFIKNSRKVTPKSFVSTYTQTSTIKKKNQFGLFSKSQNVDVAINTTPVCDYKHNTQFLLSHRGKRSLRQKEFDESQRTSESSINGATPLSAISSKGRVSLSEKHTPTARKHNCEKVSVGKRKAETKKNIESKQRNSTGLPCFVEENESLENVSKVKVKSVKKPHDNKTGGVNKLLCTKFEQQALPLQVSCIESSENVTLQQKTKEDSSERMNVSSSFDLPKRKKKDISSALSIVESPKVISKKISPKRNAGRLTKVVALKISTRKNKNKVLSSSIVKNSPIQNKKDTKSSVNLNLKDNKKGILREVKSSNKGSSRISPVVSITRRTRRDLLSPSVVLKVRKGNNPKEINPRVSAEERQDNISIPTRNLKKTEKFVSFQDPQKEISTSELSKRRRQKAAFVDTPKEVIILKHGKKDKVLTSKEEVSPDPPKRGRRRVPAVEPKKEELTAEPAKRGRHAAPVVESTKGELSPEPPKRGRRAAQIQPPLEDSVPKTLKQKKKEKPVNSKLELSPEPPKRGRRAALLEPPSEVSVPKPHMQMKKEKPVVEKVELALAVKRGRRAALVGEPLKEVLVPNSLGDIKGKRPRPAIMELSPEPPKRGRRRAPNDPPVQVPDSNPVIQGKKENLIPAKNELSPKLAKRGRPAIAHSSVEVSALKKEKKEKSVAKKEESSTALVKRGRGKTAIEDTPKETLAKKPPKRGRQAPPAQLLKDTDMPETTKRGRRAAVEESVDVAGSKLLKNKKQTEDVNKFSKKQKSTISVSNANEVSVPERPRRGRHAQSSALLSNKISESGSQNSAVKGPDFLKSKRGINVTVQENKKKPNLKTSMKPSKSNLSARIKKLSKAESLIDAIMTSEPSQKTLKVVTGKPVKRRK